MTSQADPRQQPEASFKAAAKSFGSDAERYDRARPRYPQAMVDRIVAASPGPDVLDVGCGTGIAARQFQAAGARVLGVDADERMAGLARQAGLEVEVAAFEAWDPAGRAFDAVVCGQAWHWIDAAAGAAKAAESLRPGGRLALFWNVFQPPPDVAAAFSEASRRVMPSSVPDFWARPVLDTYSPVLTKAAGGIRQAGGFGAPEQWRYEWEWPYTRDKWLDQLPTFGGHTQLPPAQLEKLVQEYGAALDAIGGSFTMHYTTVAVTTARTSPA
jgi:SAM-dependent methyltransferase